MSRAYVIKIFMVEDDPVFAGMVRRKLEDEKNFEFTLFTSGEEFLKNLYRGPDIVVLDYYLPGLSGLEILEKVTGYNREIIPILVSGQEDVKVVVQAYKMGAKDYIIKKENAIHHLLNSLDNFS